jgi:hypothetical protein
VGQCLGAAGHERKRMRALVEKEKEVMYSLLAGGGNIMNAILSNLRRRGGHRA